VPATPHVCPKCTYEHPCFFSEGEVVALEGDPDEAALAPWTGIVLEVERDKDEKLYRVLWGTPPANLSSSAAYAKHTGEHRQEELQRFLVDLIAPSEMRRDRGGGEREAVPHKFSAPRP